ncbi:MAG: nucleotide kinase [Thermoplasmata archaeon]|nr:MAG: nucleotide kinase [Thermoplasmata archaeon]
MGERIKIGLTGLPGVGKTTTLIKIIEMMEREGWKVGGMITSSIMENDKRVGFYVEDWATKRREVLAHVNIDSRVRVGKYGVDIGALERVGVAAIEWAIENADLVVVDEIGKMEVESKKFVDAVKRAFDEDKYMILTLHKKSRNPLLQDIRRRDDIRILEVTPINREVLPYKVVKLIKEEIL